MPSLFDNVIANQEKQEINKRREIASSSVSQQQALEKSGGLQRVYYIGPSGLIPGFYSSKENAFLPEFVEE